MASGDSIFGNVFGGCLSSDDIGIRHRPYHRNCTCALHKSGEQHHCSHALPPKVSYPVRRSFSEGCLVAMPMTGSSPSSPPAPPVVTPRLPPHHQLNR